MHSDERPESVNPDDEVMGSDESQDENLSWLLDQDLSESSDSLFSVTHDEPEDQGLTQAEAQMAARPLVRGSNDTDVLSAFVEEEIVVSSVGESSDIYADRAAEKAAAEAEAAAEDTMIVARGRAESGNGADSDAVSGDILGLSDEDDIGERFLVIKRRPKSAQASVQTPPADVKQPPETNGAQAPVAESSAPITSEPVKSGLLGSAEPLVQVETRVPSEAAATPDVTSSEEVSADLTVPESTDSASDPLAIDADDEDIGGLSLAPLDDDSADESLDLDLASINAEEPESLGASLEQALDTEDSDELGLADDLEFEDELSLVSLADDDSESSSEFLGDLADELDLGDQADDEVAGAEETLSDLAGSLSLADEGSDSSSGFLGELSDEMGLGEPTDLEQTTAEETLSDLSDSLSLSDDESQGADDGFLSDFAAETDALTLDETADSTISATTDDSNFLGALDESELTDLGGDDLGTPGSLAHQASELPLIAEDAENVDLSSESTGFLSDAAQSLTEPVSEMELDDATQDSIENDAASSSEDELLVEAVTVADQDDLSDTEDSSNDIELHETLDTEGSNAEDDAVFLGDVAGEPQFDDSDEGATQDDLTSELEVDFTADAGENLEDEESPDSDVAAFDEEVTFLDDATDPDLTDDADSVTAEDNEDSALAVDSADSIDMDTEAEQEAEVSSGGDESFAVIVGGLSDQDASWADDLDKSDAEEPGSDEPLGVLDEDLQPEEDALAASMNSAEALEASLNDGVFDTEFDDVEASNSDYHEDFITPREQASAVVVTVTPLLAAMVNELQNRVDDRLLDLELISEPLEVDCTLAPDTVTLNDSLAKGYVALAEFADPLPSAVEHLSEESLTAIRVRLQDSEGSRHWNRLLQDDFAPEQTDTEATETSSLAAVPDIDPSALGLAVESDDNAEVQNTDAGLDDALTDETISFDADDIDFGIETDELSADTSAVDALMDDDFDVSDFGADEQALGDKALSDTAIGEAVSFENADIAADPDENTSDAVSADDAIAALDNTELEQSETSLTDLDVEDNESTESEDESLADMAAAEADLDSDQTTDSEDPFGSLDEDDDWSLSDAAAAELTTASGDTDLDFDEFLEQAGDTSGDESNALESISALNDGDIGALVEADADEDDAVAVDASDEALLAAVEEDLEAEAADEPLLVDSELDALDEAFDAAADEDADELVASGESLEDIFGDDLDSDDFTVAADSESDVEALFESLGALGADSDKELDAALPSVDAESEADYAAPVDAAEPPAPAAVAASMDHSGKWYLPENIEFSYTSSSSAELFDDFLDAFIEEGALEIEKLEDAISEWEQDVESEEAFAPVPRILHTLKGIAKGVGLQRYGTLIHNFETLLEGVDKPKASASGPYFRIVNTWLDAAVRGFEKIQDQRTDIDSELPTAEGDDQPAAVVTAKPAAQRQAITDKDNDKQLADEGAKALAAQQTIRLTAEAVDHLMNLTNQAQQLGVRSSQGTVRGKMALAELQGRLSSVRSHISRIADRALMNVTARGGEQSSAELDALEMDQYSELQEAANILREGVEDLSELIQLSSRQNALVEGLLKQQNSIVSSLRSSIQSARVIPVSRLMPGLRRIVRTVGADLGKDVSFRVLNETGKLDRDNYSRCQVVLEHMVRNALDHGIEDAQTRLEAGKPAAGRISIDIGKDGSDYLIKLNDDGRGIDPNVIRETVYRKGLDVDVSRMSESDVMRLIFHKGFSTSSTVSEISGRGVGMDIVLSELQAIGGDIDIESSVGVGTTFTIRIPSNVTANGALLVSAGDHSYAIPLDGLIAVEYVPVDEFFDAIENDGTLALFGFDCEPAYLATLCHGETMPERKAWTGTIPVIVAGRDENVMAIAIDDVEQALELVIRTLGSQFAQVPGLAGGATTADGRAIVALDLNLLVSSLAKHGADRVAMSEGQQDELLVMVVDDSRTQRLVATSKFDSLGVETITAENGLAAIDLLNASHRLPDIILLDVEMPVKDGIQTLKDLRKSPRYMDIPVIMVTSRTGAKHRKLAAEAGCNGYMGKPFNFPLLVQDINKLTGRQLSVA